MNIIRIQQTDVQTPDDAIRFLTSTIKNSNPRLDSITYTYDLDNVQHTEEFYIDTPYVKYCLRPGDILQYDQLNEPNRAKIIKFSTKKYERTAYQKFDINLAAIKFTNNNVQDIIEFLKVYNTQSNFKVSYINLSTTSVHQIINNSEEPFQDKNSLRIEIKLKYWSIDNILTYVYDDEYLVMDLNTNTPQNLLCTVESSKFEKIYKEYINMKE